MAIDGYRYWVERHKLLLELERQKEVLAEHTDAERPAVEAELERQFRGKLDTLYADARAEFEPRN